MAYNHYLDAGDAFVPVIILLFKSNKYLKPLLVVSLYENTDKI